MKEETTVTIGFRRMASSQVTPPLWPHFVSSDSYQGGRK